MFGVTLFRSSAKTIAAITTAADNPATATPVQRASVRTGGSPRPGVSTCGPLPGAGIRQASSLHAMDTRQFRRSTATILALRVQRMHPGHIATGLAPDPSEKSIAPRTGDHFYLKGPAVSGRYRGAFRRQESREEGRCAGCSPD